MNILFTYPTIFNPCLGGIERVSDILAKEFISNGHQVFYLHNKRGAFAYNYDYPVTAQWFPAEDYNAEINHVYFREFLKEYNIDVIINQTGAFGDSKLYCDIGNSNVKVCSVIHTDPLLNYDTLFQCSLLMKNNSYKELIKLLARISLFPILKKRYLRHLKKHYQWLFNESGTKKIVLLSDKFIPAFKFIGIERTTDKIVTIANPCPYQINKNTKKEKVIIFVGRFDKFQKRPDRMLKIWAKLHTLLTDWSLIMIGDGPERKKLEQKAKKYQNIHFVGYVNPLPYYQKASILCMTSNYEGFGMVLIEAMSQGCVPIAFNSFSAIQDIICNECQLVTPFNIDEYVSKIINIVKHKKLYEELQDVGFLTSEKFMPYKIYCNWINLINSIK